ncbi:restriction endonuclease subunit S [Pectobacterium brasiliense]|uniref:restriction endonuclease subunit S n=1 Tax=Pectobacterium brasiliense TaxID=180957 RepID=UPI0015DE0661|nr:restriction endonuclease subunit S [Pectobacterium brasiliense]MBA0217829.1 restriction endonuclease subunit S [Pectobacterium brasiliense]MBN3073869.1 restriction endonuclease subunit S [Pectobacterium brasiliense]MBN3169292.1 restriction endonuclease subunit S [Pectobacterium brasiliense]
MRYDWAENILSELTDEITVGFVGSMIHEYVDSGIPFLRSKNISNYEVIWDDIKYVSSEFHKKIKKSVLRPGDVAVVRTGKPGTSCVIPDELPEANCSDLVIVRVNTHKLCPYFLCYYLNSIAVHQVNSQLVGAVQQHFNVASAKNLKIKLPSLVIQKKISHIFQCIDSKIKLNKKINQTLEKMAQALFKSWFVDFEPVKAKMAVLGAGGSQEDATLAAMTAISGKDADALMVFEREYPDQYAELKATAELFPSAIYESELGDIPEGWNLGPLSNIAIFANGKVDVSSLTAETYVSTENMLENRAGISTATSLPSVNSIPSFRSGHVLISNIRPYFKKIWLARYSGGRSADVLAFEARDAVTVEYIYNLLYQESFFDFMMLTSKGVKMPRGDKTAIMGWQCIFPDKKISDAFSKAVGKYYSFIEINNTQNKTLTQFRDTLLPKLLSGEITLPEAEQAVKEVEHV